MRSMKGMLRTALLVLVLVSASSAWSPPPALAVAGTWSFTANNMAFPRYSHTATRLASGKVLVAGGIGGTYGCCTPFLQATAELYDPVSGRWSTTGSMATARAGHTATLLTNGKVLVAGGWMPYNGYILTLASAELYDPVAGTWSTTGSLGAEFTDAGRRSHTATLLPNGQVLVAGVSTPFLAP